MAAGADWLTYRGGIHQDGWQKDEKTLNGRTITSLQLLWKRTFPEAANNLTGPSILGPFITHRGIKELVFVKASGVVYAVDADLGTVFWNRSLVDSGPSRIPGPCPEELHLMPVMLPGPDKPTDPAVKDDDDFSDGNKPLYVVSGAGTLYSLRPSTGDDFFPPRKFLSKSQQLVNLSASNNTLYATLAPACGASPDQVSSLPLNLPAAQSNIDSLAGKLENYHRALIQDPAQNQSHIAPETLAAFAWQGRDLLAGLTADGNLLLLDMTTQDTIARTSDSGTSSTGHLATWRDDRGTRWFCVAFRHSLQTFQLAGPPTAPALSPAWASPAPLDPGSLVAANGLLYALSYDGHSHSVALHAFESSSGKEVYTSQNHIDSGPPPSDIAFANGHVCFTASGTLYCFGLPFQQ